MGETFNFCLINQYHNGEGVVVWHSDGEEDLNKSRNNTP